MSSQPHKAQNQCVNPSLSPPFTFFRVHFGRQQNSSTDRRMCEHSLQLARSCRSSARGHSPASSHSARPCCTHCTSLASSCARDTHQEQSSSAQSPSLSSLSENTNPEHKRPTKTHNMSSTAEPFVYAHFQPTTHKSCKRRVNGKTEPSLSATI